MAEVPSNRYVYGFPTYCPVLFGDSPPAFCCFRSTVENSDQCAWHAAPEEVPEKPTDALQEHRAPQDVRAQAEDSDEVLYGARLSGPELPDEAPL